MGLLFGLLLGHLGVFHLRLDGIFLILRGSHPVDRTAQSPQGLSESVKTLPESWLSEIAGHAGDSINPQLPSYAPWDVFVEFTEGGELELRERGESWEWASANQRGCILSPGGVRVGRPRKPRVDRILRKEHLPRLSKLQKNWDGWGLKKDRKSLGFQGRGFWTRLLAEASLIPGKKATLFQGMVPLPKMC